jgi:hypothetical protein
MQKLTNGLTISIYDQTKVYFGDYHHVRLNLVCTFDTDAEEINRYCPEAPTLRSLSYSRIMEKMGVPSHDVARVMNSLITDFQLNALPYISSPEFPQKMIATERARKKLPVRHYSGSGS